MAAMAAKADMVGLARSFRAALLRQERAQQAEMVRQWLGVEERLMDQIMVLVYQLQSEDSPKSLHQIVMLERYQRLLAQVQAELGKYSQAVIAQVQGERDEWARRGFENGQMMVRRSLEASAMGVGLDQLPVEAVTNFTAWSGEGTALGQLLQGAFLPEGIPRGWAALQRTLVQGLALGWHPEKTAREMARALAGGLQRALVVARTEQIRAYRSASLQAYQESGVVIGHKRLTAHDSRVCAACLADEGHVYGLDEMMWSHPQCRCTSVPVLRGAEEPQWELGEEWLRRQDPATQNQIFGSWAAADAFRRGVPLKEFMRVTNEGDWGMTIRVQNPVRYLGYPGGASQPPLFPTASGSVNLNPMGEIISSHVVLPRTSKYSAAYQNALGLVDSVHGDGPLPDIVLSTRNMGKEITGAFAPFPSGWEIYINGRYSPNIETTLAHEIGHWIDFGGLGSNGMPGTAIELGGKLKGWWNAIMDTPEVKNLNQYSGTYQIVTHIQKYLLNPQELWARSYAQYIGEKTQNKEILATMEMWRNSSDYRQWRQWDPAEFAAIMEEIDKLFEAEGWMKK